MRISDWSSDVCSSDLVRPIPKEPRCRVTDVTPVFRLTGKDIQRYSGHGGLHDLCAKPFGATMGRDAVRARLRHRGVRGASRRRDRSEEHTSELQSLMRISYAVFCLKKKNTTQT